MAPDIFPICVDLVSASRIALIYATFTSIFEIFSQEVLLSKVVPMPSKPSASKTRISSTPSALSPNLRNSVFKKWNTDEKACLLFCPMYIWIVRQFWKRLNVCSRDIPPSIHCPSLCLWETSPRNHFQHRPPPREVVPRP